ncbi:hypothetical protein [Flavobacterium profundi]|uniref:hypothetical protein n=1 Tax=Flavobacterium profundi TaxID=1774945 RepID=UPI0011274FFB|nr:hypothetical protein [Flavobacterium profundi]
MHKLHPEIIDLLLWCEFLCAIVAIIKFNEIKNTYWKWFVFFIVYIFIIEKYGTHIFNLFSIEKKIYFAFIGIPLEYIFFFWLYSIKSLKNKKLFFIFTLFYFLSFIPIELYFKSFDIIYSFNTTMGSFLLMILVFLEFQKQILNDDILKFKQNKMFYINIGIMLFYVGTLPFFGLYNLIVKEPEIWNIYYLYFLLSNCLMYLLFTASFIWGKAKL